MGTETGETIASYDRGAAHYAALWRDLRLDEQVGRFAAMVRPGGLVLDLGCGPGRDVRHLAEQGLRPLGLDRSAGMLVEARRLGCPRLVRGDLRRLPLPGGCLDGVWWTASLLHLPRADAPRALSEVRRVLRPGGALFLSVQAGEGERWKPDPAFGRRFFCFYQGEELVELAAAHGFGRIDLTDGADLLRRGIHWLNLYARAA